MASLSKEPLHGSRPTDKVSLHLFRGLVHVDPIHFQSLRQSVQSLLDCLALRVTAFNLLNRCIPEIVIWLEGNCQLGWDDHELNLEVLCSGRAGNRTRVRESSNASSTSVVCASIFLSRYHRQDRERVCHSKLNPRDERRYFHGNAT